MATKTFTADGNKTVTVQGNTYTLTLSGTIPEGVHFYLNEVELVAGQAVVINANQTLTFSDEREAGQVIVNYTNATSATYDGEAFVTGEGFEVTSGTHTLNFTGATEIPSITVNGDGLSSLSVNGVEKKPSELPFTFQPTGGITNQVFAQGVTEGNRTVYISGTDIERLTVNNTPTPLPASITIDQPTYIGVAGKIYQMDVTSPGGTAITLDGSTLTDGSGKYHKIIDVNKDMYLKADGTHNIKINGKNLKSVTINGVEVPITNLPATLSNINMTAELDVNGYDPSVIHIEGMYMDSVVFDGATVPLGDKGTVDLSFETKENDHYVTINGSQPRQYKLTWDDSGSTYINMNGKRVTSGSSSLISDDVFIESESRPIPIHFEGAEDTVIEVNGKDYNSTDFTVNITQATEVDVQTETCKLTIDYGDNSYTLLVPQSVITVTAAHRDGWLFDSWSSNNVGIDNPKSVRTTVNLNGKNSATLVCHYQKYLTCDKPNIWN